VRDQKLSARMLCLRRVNNRIVKLLVAFDLQGCQGVVSAQIETAEVIILEEASRRWLLFHGQ
jgi:hypothetical protein